MSFTNTWRQRVFFFSLIAVLFTTLFSWFNTNGLCIMLMVVSRFLYRPLIGLKSAFKNPIFLAILAYCAIGATGVLYTHNMLDQTKTVSREATMVAVALVWCAGDPLDPKDYRRLLSCYYLLLLAACVYCLAIAARNYRSTRDSSVFFYHLLTRPISQNAVFFSVYVVFGMLFLLAPHGDPVIGARLPQGRNFLRVILLVFFLGMIVLLNSKLLLVIALLLLIHAMLRRYSFRQHKGILIGTGIVIVAALILVSVTKNPISMRFRDMRGNLTMVDQPVFSPDIYFNPLQLRLLEWRFASEIVHKHHSWLIGVSPGDYQDLLDQKYIQTHMYIGNPGEGPHRHVRGFIGYNSHNQYLETFMRSGLVGLLSLLTIFAAFFAAARRSGMREPWFVVLILSVFFIPEAPLTMQHGVFLFCFFPMLALAFPRSAAPSAAPAVR